MHFSSHKFCIVPEQPVTVFILATKIVRLIRSYYFNEQHFRVTISKSVPYKRIFTAASLSKSGSLRGLRSADFNGLWVTRLRFHPWLGVLDADISRISVSLDVIHVKTTPSYAIYILIVCSVRSSIRGLATPWTYFLHLSLSSVILSDSSTGSPVHVLMLSIQAVRLFYLVVLSSIHARLYIVHRTWFYRHVRSWLAAFATDVEIGA